MKKLTNVDRVMQLAQKSPAGFTAADAANVCKDAGKNTIGAMLWTLKKKGVLVHDKANRTYTLAADRKLTPVNKPAKGNGKAAEAAQAVGDQREEWKTIIATAASGAASAGMQKIMHNYNVLTQQHQSLREQHQDALAIIRYLENKLYLVIQQQAKNGNA